MDLNTGSSFLGGTLAALPPSLRVIDVVVNTSAAGIHLARVWEYATNALELLARQAAQGRLTFEPVQRIANAGRDRLVDRRILVDVDLAGAPARVAARHEAS